MISRTVSEERLMPGTLLVLFDLNSMTSVLLSLKFKKVSAIQLWMALEKLRRGWIEHMQSSTNK